MWRSKRLWFSLVVSLALLGLFLLGTDFGEIGDALADANYLWLIPGLAVYFVSLGFRSLRWSYLLRPLGNLSPGPLFAVIVIGYMANNLLPVRAGELVRAYVLGERHRLSKMATLGTIAVERVFDGLVLVLLLVAMAAVVGTNQQLRNLAIAMAVLFVGLLVIFFIVVSSQERTQRWLARLLALLPSLAWRHRIDGLMASFLVGMGSLQSPRQLALVFTTSLAVWVVEAGSYHLVGLGFGINESFAVYLMMTAAANLALSVPSSPGGIGPFELFAKQVLTLAGVGGSLAAAYVVALHAVVLLPIIALGLYFLWAIQLSLAETLRGKGRQAWAGEAEGTALSLERPAGK